MSEPAVERRSRRGAPVCSNQVVPKIIDYAGRFAFLELAAFALVRDEGVSSLSRHGVARVLATSISTVRRLLSAEADLRSLALNEVGVRRRRRLRGWGQGTGVDGALSMLGALVALRPEDVAEELVWWRVAMAAPSTATLPADPDHEEEGPLHHRFALATHGYVPVDVLEARTRPDPQEARGTDGVVAARAERDRDVAARTVDVIRTAAPGLSGDEAARQAAVLHAVIDGLGVAVAVGRLDATGAAGVARAHLETVARSHR